MAGEQMPLLPIGLVSKCRERFHDREVSPTEPEGKITVIPAGEAWGETPRNTCMCGSQMKAGPCASAGGSQPRKAGAAQSKDCFSNAVYPLAVVAIGSIWG